MKMDTIIDHHSGGNSYNQHASSLHVTPEEIAAHHKKKWNFPSQYITDPILKYAGYTVIYDPKTRIFVQCRALGEEGAHTKGHNDHAFGLGIIGNYNMQHLGSPVRTSVDPMTEQIEKDVAAFQHDLINGNKRNLIVAPDTILNFSMKRIYAHRFFSQTLCYGSFLADTWAQNLVIEYKKVTPDPTVTSSGGDIGDLKKRLVLVQTILRLYAVIFDLLHKIKLKKKSLGASDDRDCDGFIES